MLFRSPGKQGERGDPGSFRSQGDKARNEGNLARAIDYYTRHLASYAGDFDIWVQLGHIQKDTGNFDESRRAYSMARELKPADADLLLNMGHLYKRWNRLTEATELYAASAVISRGAEAYRELNMLISGEHAEATLAALIRLRALEALGPKTRGLKLIKVNDIGMLNDEPLVVTGSDPYLQFAIEAETSELTRIGELTVELVCPTSEAVVKVYFDYGGGFLESNSVKANKVGGEYHCLIAFPDKVKTVRIDIDDTGGKFDLSVVEFSSFSHPELALGGRYCGAVEGNELLAAEVSIREIFSYDVTKLVDPSLWQRRIPPAVEAAKNYDFWLDQFDTIDSFEDANIKAEAKKFAYNPLLSIVIPVYNPPVRYLEECLESILSQSYQNFEICVADDNSPNPDVRDLLENFVKRDSRVKVVFRKQNGHISAASNSALSLASGDYIVLVDHDDLLAHHALFAVVHYINYFNRPKILFSDEDKLDLNGCRVEPYFKGEFNKFLMYGHNMVSHLGVYDRELVKRVGGFRLGLEGSQDYDLLLRCIEKIEVEDIRHIPHVLYHWRMLPGSTAMSADQKSYAIIAAHKAIDGHFERTGMPLRVSDGYAPGLASVKGSSLPDTSVSIIIPTRDGLNELASCIDSILKYSSGRIEIIVIDNQSRDKETLSYLTGLELEGTVKVLKYDKPFNFSDMNNMAASTASGDIFCFLNNDTEVLTERWLDRARTFLSIDEIGAVGARLLYPNRTIQHFGVGLGMASHKVAAHLHLGLSENDHGYFSKARLMQEFSAITAACMFVRKSDFLAVGGFDVDFDVAYNDVDLCIRLRTKGLRIVVDPEIVLLHKESVTRGDDRNGEKAARLQREADKMRLKWAPILDSDPFLSPNLSMSSQYEFAFPPRIAAPWKRPVAKPNEAGLC